MSFSASAGGVGRRVSLDSSVSGLSWIVTPTASAAGVLLLLGGLAKARRPLSVIDALAKIGWRVRSRSVRALGVGEVLVGAGVLVLPGPYVAGAAAAAYVAFAAYLIYRLVHGITGGCGCGGAADILPSYLHAALNLLAATALSVGAFVGIAPIWQPATATPWFGVPYYVGTAALAYLAYRCVLLIPPLFNVVTKGVDVEWLSRVSGRVREEGAEG